MKKTLFILFIVLLFITCISTTKCFASEISYAQAVELMKKVPNEFNLDLKETDFLKATEVVEEQLKNILGTDDFIVECYKHYPWFLTEIEDIKKLIVTIYTNETNENSYLEKEVKVNYTNSSDWNEQDSKYVIESTEGKKFNRRWDYKINADGTKGEYQDKTDFSWNKVIGVDDIQVKELATGVYDDYFKEVTSYKLFLFKNDVLYKIVNATKSDTGKIIVPNETDETDDAYIKYARPIIEKFICEEDEFEVGGVHYDYKVEVNDISRTQADFIQFDIGIGYNTYVGGALDSDSFEGDTTILIAKENEYRFKLVPRLQNVEIIEKQDKTYLKGTMKITETEVGYEVSVNEKYPPEIILIDENNKEYKTTVTKGENDTYYFEIEASNLELDKNYKIQARNTSPNNKYPDNKINATLAEGTTSIEFSNNSIRVKVTEAEEDAKLSISGVKYALGDVNEDGKINTKDARLVLLNYVGKQELTANQELAADVNKDGKINTKDARQILLYYVGKITSF